MNFRKIIFWTHLSLGVTAGLGIGVIALSGTFLAFRPQVTAFAERSQSRVIPPSPGVSRLGLEALAAKAQAAKPEASLTGLSLSSDPNASVLFNFGKNGILYLDPYQGLVLGAGNPQVRRFFQWVEGIHRWFGFQEIARDKASSVKGALTLLFGFIILTGFTLWWPQKWTSQVFKVIGIPNFKLQGKQRDWNWHNAVGFWSAPWLLLIVLTGLIMAYPWANDLLYRLTGNEPPSRPAQFDRAKNGTNGKFQESGQRHGKGEGHGRRNRGENPDPENRMDKSTFSLDKVLETVDQKCPGWKSLNVRFPQGGNPALLLQIEEASAPGSFTRSSLTLDSSTGEILKWEPYSEQNLGRKLRLWARFIHTGEAGGILGQTLAALASLGALTLVVTGLSMACRRFFTS